MTGRPKSLALADVVAALTGGQPAPEAVPSVGIRSAVVDSRLAVQGSLFVALRGEQHDGHDFVAQAIANGCSGRHRREAGGSRPTASRWICVDRVLRSGAWSLAGLCAWWCRTAWQPCSRQQPTGAGSTISR